VAIVKVNDHSALPSLEFGEAEKTRVGDWVLAVGNPFGLSQTVTAGIVSAHDLQVDAVYEDFLQVNAMINPGDAGGPLLNLQGQVVGINTAMLRDQTGNAGIAFALSSDSAKRVIEQLEKEGKVVRGWLGLSVEPLTEDLAASLDLSEPLGALVSDVVASGPAAQAGIQRGDVIVTYRGTEVALATDLPRRVAATDVGTRVAIRVIRGGKPQELVATVVEMPQSAEKQTASPQQQNRGVLQAGMGSERDRNAGLTSYNRRRVVPTDLAVRGAALSR
jgi:serine protease Do